MSRAVVVLVVAVLSLIPRQTGELAIELFAPGIISTPEAVEYYPTFTPDGRRIWFVRADAFTLEARRTIYVSDLQAGVWSEPKPAAFSGVWSDTEPFVAPDGKSLFFASNRPADGKGEKDFDLWVVPLEDGIPAQPRHLGPAVNSSSPEHSPVVTRDGSLYFRSSRPGGLGQGDLYRSRRIAGALAEPENLGAPVNSANGEWNCVVHPEGEFLIFEASGRPTNVSARGDLYFSRRHGEGWSAPIHLSALNTAASDLAARLSPDGVWLYFSSNRAGGDNVEIYRVKMEAVLAAVPGGPS